MLIKYFSLIMTVAAHIAFAGFFATTLNYNGIYSYNIPQPKIEVFSPRGLRVSIEDSPGLSAFEFHGNVNRRITETDHGSYSEKICHSHNGRWVIEFKPVELDIGDQIYYWLSVMKNNLEHRQNVQCFNVKELNLSPYESQLKPRPSPATKLPYITQATTEAQKRKATIGATTLPSHTFNDLILCQETVLNSTQVLINLRNELEKTKKLNKQLVTAIEEYPGSKQMKLSGRIPPDDTPAATVQFILREKLDLRPKISWAVREDNYTIIFEVPSVLDKYGILAIANEKLKNSKIYLS